MITFKGIVCDFNNIFLWQKLKDINKKKKKKKKKKGYIQNFSWFQFYIYRLRMIYVHWRCSIDYCVNPGCEMGPKSPALLGLNWFSSTRIYGKLLLLHTEMISA